MSKLALAIAVVVGAAGFFLLGRDSKADDVRACIEKAGGSVEKSQHFRQLFPYLMALGQSARVRSFPEHEGAAVYGVKHGAGEALLFVGKNGEAARSFEQALSDFAATDGADLSSRRTDNLLLIWTVPDPASGPIDDCVAGG